MVNYEYFRYEAPRNSFISAFSGLSDSSYIFYLGVYVPVNTDIVCACGGETGGDGVCTPLCNTEACGFDGGDCENPEDPEDYAPFCTCDTELLNNGYCNKECSNFECLWDGMDCAVESGSNSFFGPAGSIGKEISLRNKYPYYSDLSDFRIGNGWKIKGLDIYWSTYLYNIRTIYENEFGEIKRS